MKPRTHFQKLHAKSALHAVQVVWFGLPCVLVLCHSSVVQMLPLEERSGLVALQLLPAQPVGHLPPELSKYLQHELSKHLHNELSEHLQAELSKHLHDEQFELVRTHLVRWSASAG